MNNQCLKSIALVLFGSLEQGCPACSSAAIGYDRTRSLSQLAHAYSNAKIFIHLCVDLPALGLSEQHNTVGGHNQQYAVVLNDNLET